MPLLDSNTINCLWDVVIYLLTGLDCILNSCSFLKYLALTLQTDGSSFLPSFWFEITMTKDCPWVSLEGTMQGLPYLPKWLPNFRDLSPEFMYRWRRPHLTCGPVQMLKPSESNWQVIEAPDIKVDCFLPRETNQDFLL